MPAPNEGTTNLPSDAAARYFLGVWDGTNFYAIRGDTANGADVDVTRVQGTVTVDSELPAARAGADALSNPTAPDVLAARMGFNGTTWDRWRNNLGITSLLASAARTATTDSAIQTNYNFRGILLLLNVSAAGTGFLNLTVVVNDGGGAPFQISTSANITGTGKYGLVLGLGANLTNAGAHLNAATGAPVPRSWYGRILHSDSSSWTYLLDYYGSI